MSKRPLIIQQSAPGRRYLLVAGILYIVLVSFSFFFWIYGQMFSPNLGEYLVIVHFAIWGFHLCYRIFISVMGLAHCDNVQRAGLILILGIGDIAIIVSSNIILFYSFFYMYGAALDVLSTVIILIDLALSALYIIGAAKNKARQKNLSQKNAADLETISK